MNRDDILNMPAGREMDARIENIIFKHLPYQDGLDIWRVEISDKTGRVLPKYTTDIAAVWELKEKVGFPMSLVESMLGGGFSCEFLVDFETEKTVEATADTAPLAICRAALLAVMEAK